MGKRILLGLSLIAVGFLGSLNAQTADGGIFGSGTTITVKFRPSVDITGAFTGGNFGIRWLSSLGAGVNLSGETGSFGYINQGPKETDGLYSYIVYASTSSIAITTYTGGVEYTLMSVTVSGGVGTGTFELCDAAFAGGAGTWYIELGGADRANPNPANWYYQASATGVPLPVQLTSFVGAVQGNKVQLSWKTATEVNSNVFEVERRAIGGDWQKIGELRAAGTSNAPREYSYVDVTRNISSGNVLYRLKTIDIDGSFKYSSEVEVAVVPQVFELGQNYPNPFNPQTKIQYSLPENSKVRLVVYDVIGREVAALVNEEQQAGYYEKIFTGTNLSSGLYFYRLTAQSQGQNTFTHVKKMLLVK